VEEVEELAQVGTAVGPLVPDQEEQVQQIQFQEVTSNLCRRWRWRRKITIISTSRSRWIRWRWSMEVLVLEY
jgi:hypothetical protein